jgi:hypothetical protein
MIFLPSIGILIFMPDAKAGSTLPEPALSVVEWGEISLWVRNRLTFGHCSAVAAADTNVSVN